MEHINGYEGLVGFSTLLVVWKSLQFICNTYDENGNRIRAKSLSGLGRTVSAPGKALIAGGYLVTDSPNIGVVLGADARFYTTTSILENSPRIHRSRSNSSTSSLVNSSSSNSHRTITIFVDSPQFHTDYLYSFDFESKSLKLLEGKENPFVETCLSVCLGFIATEGGQDFIHFVTTELTDDRILGIKLRADNDFYSQIDTLRLRGLTPSHENLSRLPRFMPCPKTAEGKVIVNKTGMGSSAALTTSLVGSLINFFFCYNIEEFRNSKVVVHNLSQLAHAIAQKKVGSGFDVGSAVYGSIIYRRFDATALKDCLEAETETGIPNAAVLRNAVLDGNRWNQCVDRFTMPPGLDLMMGDVNGGSSTTSMTKKVKHWLKTGGDQAATVWSDLAVVNEKIASALDELNEISVDTEVYNKSLVHLCNHDPKEWSVYCRSGDGDFSRMRDRNLEKLVGKWAALRELFLESRRLLKHMGEQSGVDIEPDEQTRLADVTMKIPGVISAGVPGAGGVDAIYAIIVQIPTTATAGVDGKDTRSRVSEIWSKWETRTVCPLLLGVDGISSISSSSSSNSLSSMTPLDVLEDVLEDVLDPTFNASLDRCGVRVEQDVFW